MFYFSFLMVTLGYNVRASSVKCDDLNFTRIFIMPPLHIEDGAKKEDTHFFNDKFSRGTLILTTLQQEMYNA